jgi:hypothetical protein
LGILVWVLDVPVLIGEQIKRKASDRAEPSDKAM